jgi:phosphatidylglycerophosphate synthase
MVSTALVLLASSPPAPISAPAMVVPVLVTIGREIAMSSLREWAASSGGCAHQVRTTCCDACYPHICTCPHNVCMLAAAH